MDKFFLVTLPIAGRLLHIRFVLDLTSSGSSQFGHKKSWTFQRFTIWKAKSIAVTVESTAIQLKSDI
jgi:hypothetical protein